jgi:hypothetical protein
MAKVVEKSEWAYKVCRVWGNGGWGETEYRPGAYTCKKEAIKALHYYGRGFVEAVRYVRTRFYGGTSEGSEYKKVYEL